MSERILKTIKENSNERDEIIDALLESLIDSINNSGILGDNVTYNNNELENNFYYHITKWWENWEIEGKMWCDK